MPVTKRDSSVDIKLVLKLQSRFYNIPDKMHFTGIYSFQTTFPHPSKLFSPSISELLQGIYILSSNGQNRLIPLAGRLPLCPLQAEQDMCAKYPLPSNSPMFTYNTPQGMVSATQAQASTVLASLLVAIDLICPNLDSILFGIRGRPWHLASNHHSTILRSMVPWHSTRCDGTSISLNNLQ